MNYTNELNLPKPLVDAATSSYKYKKNRYSVTALLGGTCEAILRRRHDSEITEDVSQRIWAVFGTAVHKVLQEAEATETQLQENWMSVPITVKKNGNCDKDGNPVEPYEKVGNYELRYLTYTTTPRVRSRTTRRVRHGKSYSVTSRTGESRLWPTVGC